MFSFGPRSIIIQRTPTKARNLQRAKLIARVLYPVQAVEDHEWPGHEDAVAADVIQMVEPEEQLDNIFQAALQKESLAQSFARANPRKWKAQIPELTDGGTFLEQLKILEQSDIMPR
jgi:hypothetical protein